MKRNLIHFLLVALLSAFATAASAQMKVTGQLVDAETGEPLIGASVLVEGTQQGSVTDVDGNFEQQLPSGGATLIFRYIGYQDQKQEVTRGGNLGVIELKADAVLLNDVVVTSSVAIARKTPVAASTVTPVFIEERLGTQEFPEILKTTPGVYATKKGGGFGDSEIRMRGFKSENIAVLINGVPMNDMEWGGVYWSNWAGLSDVTRSMQTQRGLGASKVSAPSVGGSINIITNSTEAKRGGSISYALGNDGYNKIMFNVSTGLSKSGWALTLLGAKTWGDGYVQGTEFEAYNWFVNLSKRINDNHQLSLTAFGAPQWHNQRNDANGLTIEGWQQVRRYMNDPDDVYRYNPAFGYGKNGERKNQNHNAYNKPQISLNHQWQIDHKSSLSTVLYTSIGRGYGYSGQANTAIDGVSRSDWYGASDGVLNSKFRHEDGTFAYDEMQELNEQSVNGSLYAMSKSKNYHNWYGLISTYTSKFGDYVDFYGGIDLRYYKGTHTNELVDLYNGKFFMDIDSRENVHVENNAAAANPGFVNQKLNVGDVVYRDYDGYVLQEGVFAQAEYNRDKLAAFLAGSLSNTTYWRYDRFYYDAAHAKSDKVSFLGFTAKGGANYNITDEHNVFANVGYISRAPFFSGGAFLSSATSNATNPDAVNEKIFSAELGYGFHNRWLQLNFNAYFTRWMDKTMTAGGDIRNPEGVNVDRYSVNMQGVDARHMGLELDLVANPTRWLDITGMLSVGDWQWDSNATGYYYNSLGQPLKDTQGNLASGIMAPDHAHATINLDGIKVGGSAQLTASLGAQVHFSGFRGGLTYVWFANNYSDYDIDGGLISPGGDVTITDPWKIPAGGQMDFNASYTFDFGKCRATLYGNIENLFDQRYIVDAVDGGGTWDKAYGVFYAFGRQYSVRLKVTF